MVRKLQAVTQQAMQDPKLRKVLDPQGFVSAGSSTEQAQRTLTAEIAKTQSLVAGAGLVAE